MKLTLTKAGPYKIEQVAVPHAVTDCDASRPPAGVMHTTEGSFENALNVFREHYAPNLMVGKDAAGRVRVLQFIPIGQMAYALANEYGGGETNLWARCQIELVGYSSQSPWLPAADVRDALAWVMATLRDEAGIPLARPGFATPWSLESAGATNNLRRRGGRWGREPGWYGHAEIPEQAPTWHWDPGNLRWQDLLDRALEFSEPDPPPLRECYVLGAGGPPAIVVDAAWRGEDRGKELVERAEWINLANKHGRVVLDLQERRKLPVRGKPVT